MSECPHQLGADNYQGTSASCTAALLLNDLKLGNVLREEWWAIFKFDRPNHVK